MPDPVPARGWIGRFGLLALVWGLTFGFVKLGLAGFAAPVVSFGRVAFGAIAVLAVVLVTGSRIPTGAGLWLRLAVAALLLNTVPFTLFAYAGERIPSALVSICNASTPLFTLLVALVALPAERPSPRRVLGLGVGFCGVLVVFGVWRVGSGDTAGMAMAVGAAASMGAGWAFVRRFLTGSGHPDLSLAGIQLLLGAVQLAVLAPLLTPLPTAFPIGPVLAVVALGVVGTGLAFALQYGLVRDAGATVASTVTYVVPVVATVAGVALLGERLSWNQPLGAAVILAGAALLRPASPRTVRV
ncbi:DMT family transporter [Pseudonocardia sp. HH130630-07]|uniref:DMT family transporter n=1 Tax=Pseudonocardia sp. HH130630-07 TaxID=1690815 RepID=UPI000815031D|nr:DMT family transporter [Pseudonocardia sp. HH130630-07]ANY07827.1 multidrug transporter [Pseudonocardia sp. HH130630-07]